MAVYYRSLSRDWARLEPLLADATVARHLTDMVLSRIAVGGWMTEAYITPFGALQLPALVMAEPNGTFTVLEKPTSSDMIARFARTAISEVRDAGAGSTASASP